MKEGEEVTEKQMKNAGIENRTVYLEEQGQESREKEEKETESNVQ